MHLTPKTPFLAWRGGVYYAREALGSALDSFYLIQQSGDQIFIPAKITPSSEAVS